MANMITSMKQVKHTVPIAAVMFCLFSPAQLSLAAESERKDELGAKIEELTPDQSGWSSSVINGANEYLSPEQRALIVKINNYFNKVTDLKGRFIQINPDDSQQKGKFFMKRPGRIRFDYSPPSLQKIIADGEYLSIEDRDLGSVDRFPLDSTPFRILLAETVHIARDAVIKAVAENDQEIAVTMLDSEGKAIGKIQLFFNKEPELELREWKVTDAQGLETRIILSHLAYDKKIDGKLFTLEDHSNPYFRP